MQLWDFSLCDHALTEAEVNKELAHSRLEYINSALHFAAHSNLKDFEPFVNKWFYACLYEGHWLDQDGQYRADILNAAVIDPVGNELYRDFGITAGTAFYGFACRPVSMNGLLKLRNDIAVKKLQEEKKLLEAKLKA